MEGGAAMADAAVNFLLGNLQRLLNHHLDLIINAKAELEKLEDDIRLFKKFLQDSAKKRRQDNNAYQELVRQIREVVYKAEDALDTFVTQATVDKTKSYFRKAVIKPLQLHQIASQVRPISKQIRDIYADRTQFAALNDAAPAPQLREAPIVKRDNVVGFDEEVLTITRYLNEARPDLDVISVIGMPGLGKTTLAWKIFHDEKVKYEFPTRIWVYVSQEFTMKDIYLAIIKGFTSTISQDMKDKTETELNPIVYDYLQSGKFLIVLDDVWSTQDWDRIEKVFPKKNNAGKVLLTSRDQRVALHANRQRDPHNLKFLTQEEGWLLLQYEVFGKPDEYPSELKHLGNLIVKECGRLPLAIVVIGGILLDNFCRSDDINTKITAWGRISNSVNDYLQEDPAKRMEKIIALSYDKLPYHLRACFLYLGMFPEDYEIPVWKLTRMWIAEGFIQQDDQRSLEIVAEDYLNDLINRNLVRIDKRRNDGRVKSCRIHDMLSDFCKREAKKENFLLEMRCNAEGFGDLMREIPRYRRICIHSNVVRFISLRPVGSGVRSFVCFSKEELTLLPENTAAIPAGFKLLRVMDAKPIKIKKIPSDMYELVHLRYLTLSFSLGILPGAFDKLWNLETLIVETSERTLEIRADIWKMSQLRHIKTNASAILPKVAKSSKEGEKLQTLGTISPQSCTKEVFDRARNLKKLGIRGKLSTLLDESFNNLEKLYGLEKLKLLNDVFPNPASDGQLRRLPPTYQFPQKLKSLTLSETFLVWADHMHILGALENLKVLKLKENAFKGNLWKAKDGDFRCLEMLHIGRTDLSFWEASQNHYPKLKRLELHNCEELENVPIGLADIPSFQVLELYRCKDAAAPSATKILEAKKAQLGEQRVRDGGFKLSIFPPTQT